MKKLFASLRSRWFAVTPRVAFLAPLLARLAVGGVFVDSGWKKMNDLFTVEVFFSSLGIPAPAFHARLVSGTEFFGGILILLGLGTRFASVPLSVTMLVAIITARWQADSGLSDLVGWDEFTYLLVMLSLVFSGGGMVSLDALIARKLRPAEPSPTVAQG